MTAGSQGIPSGPSVHPASSHCRQLARASAARARMARWRVRSSAASRAACSTPHSRTLPHPVQGTSAGLPFGCFGQTGGMASRASTSVTLPPESTKGLMGWVGLGWVGPRQSRDGTRPSHVLSRVTDPVTGTVTLACSSRDFRLRRRALSRAFSISALVHSGFQSWNHQPFSPSFAPDFQSPAETRRLASCIPRGFSFTNHSGTNPSVKYAMQNDPETVHNPSASMPARRAFGCEWKASSTGNQDISGLPSVVVCVPRRIRRGRFCRIGTLLRRAAGAVRIRPLFRSVA